MSAAGAQPSLPEPDPGSVANALYVIWGAIGFSILAEFGLLLFLQREGRIRIDDSGGPLSPSAHLALALVLAIATLLLANALRARLRDPAALARGTGSRTPPRRGQAPSSPAPSLRTSLPIFPPGGPAAPRVVAGRFLALSVAQWAAAEGLALVGLLLALALQPAPRLALILYFTLALALWVWFRPDPHALSEALRRAEARS
jgi:hypothetical protein